MSAGSAGKETVMAGSSAREAIRNSPLARVMETAGMVEVPPSRFMPNSPEVLL